MRAWLRPGLLVGVVLLLGLVCAGSYYYLRGLDDHAPHPLPVGSDEREIVWLDTATSSANWEQFVAALQRAEKDLKDEFPGLSVRVARDAEPDQARVVPEVVVSWPGAPRLIFRWYKLTSEYRTAAWVGALLARPTPPLAIIGGSSTNRARELAWQLENQGRDLPPERRPILLMTTASADRVPLPKGAKPEPVPADTEVDEHLQAQDTPQAWLSDLYPKRTFRFGFTNLQIADAIVQFIWSQPDLRPEVAPAHLIRWNDDTYSRDLVNGFRKGLRLLGDREPTARGTPLVHPIPFGVGGFDRPNDFEEAAVDGIGAVLHSDPHSQGRMLLVVTGQAQPARRFLRGLACFSPDIARRVVVAAGDALPFNTIYRDRLILWPIQDLPFPVVFFCHYNPIDPDIGLRQQPDARPVFSPEREGHARPTEASGTDEILLNVHLVTQLIRAAWKEEPVRDPPQLAERLHDARQDGKPVFESNGQRRTGTGEYVVCLRPVRPRSRPGEGPREALVSVWVRHLDDGGSPAWQKCLPEDMHAYYDERPVKGDSSP